MIKLILADEEPRPVQTVRFEFRRHASPTSLNTEQQAFLVAEVVVGTGPVLPKTYPVKIDGARQTVEIRKRDFELLGFTVVVKD